MPSVTKLSCMHYVLMLHRSSPKVLFVVCIVVKPGPGIVALDEIWRLVKDALRYLHFVSNQRHRIHPPQMSNHSIHKAELNRSLSKQYYSIKYND